MAQEKGECLEFWPGFRGFGVKKDTESKCEKQHGRSTAITRGNCPNCTLIAPDRGDPTLEKSDFSELIADVVTSANVDSRERQTMTLRYFTSESDTRRQLLVAALSSSLWALNCSPGSGVRASGNGGNDGSSGGGSFNPGSSSGGNNSNPFYAGSDASTPGQPNAALCTKFGNLACSIRDCGAQPKTTVTAKVYDPAGKNPLYNVVAYVPNAQVGPITNGATCETCATPVSGQPIASTLTDAAGQFTMQDVPVGTNIPMVLQIGKWRRQITIPEVKACQDNAFDDPNLFRLPRNQSEGNIPKIAIAAGDADRLQCLFRRIGVDATEFTNPDGAGAINIYNQLYDPDQGGAYDNGVAYPAAAPMWEDINQMMRYDIVMLACGGNQARFNPTSSSGTYITPNAKNVMLQYANSGGRVLAEHFHWTWIRTFTKTGSNPVVYPSPFGDVATWIEPISTDAIGTTMNTYIDTTFPKGQAMADWLLAVGATQTAGTLTLTGEVKATAVDVTPPNPAVSQRWIYEPVSGTSGPAARTHYFSFNTPIASAPENQCGRFVYTGLHVTTSDSNAADKKSTFPSCCQVRDLLPQEKALEFMVFDLSSCVLPPDIQQQPPPPIT